jgi:hypothetical protein
MESSKYRFCAWKWCGARYIPSDQIILESSFIDGKPSNLRYSLLNRINSEAESLARQLFQGVVLAKRAYPARPRGRGENN